MFIAGPAVQPNSAENAFDSTATSWTAPTGTVASIVWRPQPSSLLAPSSMNVVVRRLPRAGDEVGRVDEEIAGALALTERGVEQRQRGDLAAEDRRLVDRLAVETAADLRVGAHALVRAVDGDFGLAAGGDQLHLDRRRFAGAQRQSAGVLGGEAGLADADACSRRSAAAP